MKRKVYQPHNLEIQRRIREYLSPEDIQEVHKRAAWKHFAIVLQQTILLIGLGILAYNITNPWIWAPLALFQGFVILSFIILLHEQIHNAIFSKKRPFIERLLGMYYGLPSSISPSQFKRWHLDHHNELGSTTDDPKRAYLSPKKNTPWFKALYMTPALFVIYSIASSKEAKSYPKKLVLTMVAERVVLLGCHVALLLWLVQSGGWDAWFRVHGAPLFLAFPFAFTLNRLGQHYAIDPEDPAKWATLVNSNKFWDWLFVYSNLHLEHHYLVGVPCYNLPKLNRMLQPFYRDIGHEPYGYGKLLYNWFVKNAEPHTQWQKKPPTTKGMVAGGSTMRR
ncbi:MAG: hypothetical protein HKN21_06485 [Candidatus Eisenbacteria bacterium]|uniref:Fatty acid desaturase domain-containing protein n=1 Tax=Eiseniibacteriota bacterium TaxID=2212470 RepID=A0A7Y2E6Z8_UNCEI|nr:hypothetical protein [Candidatus Eisenbacteria bacterium]